MNKIIQHKHIIKGNKTYVCYFIFEFSCDSFAETLGDFEMNNTLERATVNFKFSGTERMHNFCIYHLKSWCSGTEI